jgi:hypothetical protein
MNTHIILNIIFAAILFFAAYYIFDWYNWTSIAISAVLALSGIDNLLRDSESKARRELGRSCLRLAGVIAVFLIVKLLVFG